MTELFCEVIANAAIITPGSGVDDYRQPKEKEDGNFDG